LFSRIVLADRRAIGIVLRPPSPSSVYGMYCG